MHQVNAQVIPISSAGTPYLQDFNTLDSNTTGSTNVPAGWLILEVGGTATTSYRSGTGSSNTGDTYSFGSAGSTDRTLGSVASGTVQSRFGARFLNSTGATISSVTISLTMEQWRSVTRTNNTLDSLYFSYGTNNGNLGSGTWTRFTALDLLSTNVTGGSAGTAVDGNLSANKASYSATITGLSIANGDTLYIRWSDPNITGSDDGLGIDDFSLTATTTGGGPTPPAAVTAVNFTNLAQTSATIGWTKPVGYNSATMTTVVFVKQGSAITQGSPSSVVATLYAPDPNFGAGSSYANDLAAHCVFNDDTNFVNITGLTANTSYYALIYVFRNTDSAYSAAATANGSTAAAGTVLPVTSLTFTATGQTTAQVNWTKPAGYNDGTQTTLIFLKAAAAITAGTPTAGGSAYTANADFSLSNSFYQNDAAAKCVFKGDNPPAAISGLASGTAYYLLAYVINDSDSSYAAGVTANTTTLLPPPSAVTGVTFTGMSTTSANIAWTKPAGYTNATHTTLVFVKQGTAVIPGTPAKPASFYSGLPFFGFGTQYEHDTAARCVFKGDTNFVTLSNITNTATYHVLVYVVRDADSSYSPGATGSGSALPPPPPPPYYNIAQINHTNIVSGNPDSLNVRVGLRGVVYGFNQRSTGAQFMLRDQTGGITVLSQVNAFGYTVTEGDSVEVQGTVSSNRGLVTLNPIDTLKKLASGHALKSPTNVLVLNESTENDLVRLNNVRFLTVPTGSNWPSSNVQALTANNDTITIRLTTTSPLAGTPLPLTPTFHITGMGAQSSSSFVAPFQFNGYQLIPRRASDITPVDSLSRPFNLIRPSAADTLHEPVDTAAKDTFVWHSTRTALGVAPGSYVWMLDTAVITASSTPLMVFATNDTMFSIQSWKIAQLFPQSGRYRTFHWTVKAELNGSARFADNNASFIYEHKVATGIHNVDISNSLRVYPNPAGRFITIEADQQLSAICVIDLTGRELLHVSSLSAISHTLDLGALSKGVYLVKVGTANGSAVKRIIVK